MREILFRGKRKDNGEWVYGSSVLFFKETTKIYGELVQWREIEVIPETVGQFTGLTDKNGKKIFEGDIVNVTTGIKGYKTTYHIVTQKVRYTADDSGIAVFLPFDNSDMIEAEIIGNIFDNLELLEKL